MNMENLKDYKEKPNKELLEKLFKLKNEFDKTKSLIVNLTYHLDKVEKAYNQINDEMKKRLGDDK
jgi:methylthioribose-1-phosphate isomerase|tara:strand:- start:382 stop:576 length:195 start_codon:yes stop_codon:yes gene_type:complete